MNIIYKFIPFVPILPLLGAIFLGLFGKKFHKKFGETATGIVGCLTPGLAGIIAYTCFFILLSMPEAERSVTVEMAPWFGTGIFQIGWTLTYDVLSAMMLLIITGIGFLIHVYAMGYMQGDKSFWRFFSYVNLFTASMLMLVLGDNLIVMFLGWEGVGLCSYLLIGFWFDTEANAVAGKKAFITNRVGDLGFLTGIFLIMMFSMQNPDFLEITLSFDELSQRIGYLAEQSIWGLPLLEVVGFCFFIGAMGKSAQIPLYVWLPDAMAGPTPVSALIHAATMVTAGVYMMARMNFLYSLAPQTLGIVAIIASLTCIFSASIGLTQFDIKKVLAYSTVSQLGYMFVAMGVGAYSAGVFHLLSHAAFKAALFMGSGAVIVAMHHEQDMRKMGGLLKKMPVTGWSFILATFAIMGFPGTCGFFSKDEILWKAFSQGNYFLWLIGFIAAGMTSFYMWRLVFMTFFGKTRADHHTYEHCHEQPKRTVLPIAILAIASMLIGWLNVPHFLGGHSNFSQYLSPEVKDLSVAPAVHYKELMANKAAHNNHQATAPSGHAHEEHHAEDHSGHAAHGEISAHGGDAAHGENAAHGEDAAHGGHADHSQLEWDLMVASVLWTLFTAFLAYIMYLGKPQLRLFIMRFSLSRSVFTLLYNKYYVDELYEAVILNRLRDLYILMSAVDKYIVDGVVNLMGWLSKVLAKITGGFDAEFVDGNINGAADMIQQGGRLVSRMQAGKVQKVILSSLLIFSALVVCLFYLLIKS
ncbi:MAG: NADH-quinone oxidoreductase subunit L [Planctomycetes bacterium]|nr:NADH-quinone oxidoreductase subunit L [Planctomycetota bacterium]